jgi:hypothetical protein
MTTTMEQQWIDAFNKLQSLSDQLQVGDPFNYNRGREIHTAFMLGHTVSGTLAGADAYEGTDPLEYKSTIGALKATYNGVSVQPTWEEQEEYLVNEKIGKYKRHYITRYENNKLIECWCLSSDDVLAALLPKFKKQYHSSNARKDPRLSASLNAKEIRQLGFRVIFKGQE